MQSLSLYSLMTKLKNNSSFLLLNWKKLKISVSRDRMTSIVRDELLYDVIKVELKNVAVQTMRYICTSFTTHCSLSAFLLHLLDSRLVIFLTKCGLKVLQRCQQ